MIRYAQILEDSVVDGPGIRLVVFLQGCQWNCKGCHNPQLFPLDEGIEISEVQLAKMILKKLNSMHSGITFSGGDPLLQSEALLKVSDYIRSRKPEINIWLYTGFLFEDIKNLKVLENIDVVVDGPFLIEEKDISLRFKGSANQRIIDVKKTLEIQEIKVLNI